MFWEICGIEMWRVQGGWISFFFLFSGYILGVLVIFYREKKNETREKKRKKLHERETIKHDRLVFFAQ